MSKDWKEYDWSDVRPNPVPDTPGHVAQIAYSDAFRKAMGIFRAVSESQELSERVLALTTGVIEMNPAHYSVWDYRLEVCKAVGNEVFDYRKVGLTPESPRPPLIGDNGEWLNMFTLANAKNYQVWNYRQHLLDATNPLWYKNERLLVSMVLEDDSKNFHAWSHLKWCISQSLTEYPKAFDPAELLDQMNLMLDDDVLNNSVWSFRYFFWHSFPQIRQPKEELEFIFDKIAESPDNESVWSYLTGLLNILAPELKHEALLRATVYADGGEARAVEFLAEMSDTEKSNRYYQQLGELEPSRKKFWDSRITF